jgi:hypothetical protein
LLDNDTSEGEDDRSLNRPARCDEHRNRAQAMNMDIWYEFRLLEMSDLNGAANELLREADAISGSSDDAEDEE